MFIVNKMQQFLVFHLLILISLTTTLSETAISYAGDVYNQQPACAGENCRGLSYGSTGRRCSSYDRCSGSPSYNQRPCDKRCGAVGIEYPFGIGTNCSANEWFSVDCFNSTPYLSAINHVEMLYGGQGTVTVNMSVIKVDCKNPIQNTSSVLINTTHGESPFRISGSGNMLVVKGCGNGVIMDGNQNIVSGCSTTCDKDTVGDINNCFGDGCCKTTVPFNQESFSLSVTGLVQDRTCGSAFLVHRDYAERSSDSFVPISLDYNMEKQGTCGELEIPFPFWTEETRQANVTSWFKVDCKSLEPYLSKFNNVRVMNINLEAKTLLVNAPVISECKNRVQKSSLVLTKSPFVFSKSENLFVVEGCGKAAITLNNGTTVTGCSTTCGKDTVFGDAKNCFGDGCCQTTIPDELKSFNLNLMGLQIQLENGSCAGSAFLVDRGSFTEGTFSRQFVPVTLGWGNNTGDEDSKGLSSACKLCRDQGGYCYTDNSGTRCFHSENERRKKDYQFSKAVILGVSISMGLVILTVTIYALYKIIKKTKARRRRQRFFKRNGGLLLKQQQKPDIGLVDKTILFTSRELEKATDHFNENRILGRGGQGTVYKGMLADGRIVAIKKSKVVDESQLEQFINEVVILSQVNHRNVVKLLGCCLETDVPLLVSEFIPNGTLYDLIHDETDEFPFSFNIRLQIAAEVSGAVSYLHSATSIPIYHRDIKTTNILLDEKYRAKVSDFGTSKFVSIGQTHLTTLVKGTLGYLDPEYYQSSQFTEKSDVYSFGVVLLELLTREKPISSTDHGEKRNLATHFLLAMEEGRVMSLFDVTAVKEGSRNELLALANLAIRCLNVNGKNRPTMKEVSIELEGIRLSHVPSTVQTSFGNVKKCEEVPLTYGESSSVSSMTYDDNHSL